MDNNLNEQFLPDGMLIAMKRTADDNMKDENKLFLRGTNFMRSVFISFAGYSDIAATRNAKYGFPSNTEVVDTVKWYHAMLDVALKI